MGDAEIVGPESTAVRVALWRAMHVQLDPAPHVIEDEVGLQLIDPDDVTTEAIELSMSESSASLISA